jgi:long-chain fatty acid transport protein
MKKTIRDARYAPVQTCTFMRRCCLLTWSVALLIPADLMALGFRIPNQDAEATARGNAFVATADNPSALYYNPAGITQLEGTTAQFGAHILSINSHFESTTPGVESDTEFEIQPVPQFYATYTPKDKPFSFGLGIYAPFGLGIEWPEDGPLRPYAIEGRLLYTTITPVVAWKIHPTLSVAAGPTFDIATLMIRQGTGIPGVNEFHFRGNGFTAGAKVGILWQPHSKWSFGASYTSPTTVKFNGNSNFNPLTGDSDTEAKAAFPQFVTAGISYRPSSHWNVEIGMDWTDWNTLNTVYFNGTPFGNVPFALNWKASWMAHSGVSYYFDNRYWVAAGYFFSEDSTTEPDFSALVPDTNLHVASLGFGRKGEKWSWALSGQLIAGPKRSINNGTGMDGTYQWFNQAVNFSIAYRF